MCPAVRWRMFVELTNVYLSVEPGRVAASLARACPFCLLLAMWHRGHKRQPWLLLRPPDVWFPFRVQLCQRTSPDLSPAPRYSVYGSPSECKIKELILLSENLSISPVCCLIYEKMDLIERALTTNWILNSFKPICFSSSLEYKFMRAQVSYSLLYPQGSEVLSLVLSRL